MPLDNRELSDLEKSSGSGGCSIFIGILIIIGIVISIIEFDIDSFIFQVKTVFWWIIIMLGGGLIIAFFPSRMNNNNKLKKKDLSRIKNKNIYEENEVLYPKETGIAYGLTSLRESENQLVTGEVVHRNFNNNQIIMKRIFENGKLLDSKWYDKFGKLKNGIYKEYYSDNKIKEEEIYKNGTLISSKKWGINGSLLWEDVYD